MYYRMYDMVAMTMRTREHNTKISILIVCPRINWSEFELFSLLTPTNHNNIKSVIMKTLNRENK